MKTKLLLFLINCTLCLGLNAQKTKIDSLSTPPKKTFKPYIIPTAMVSYGLFSLANNNLRSLDKNLNSNFENSKHIPIDDAGMVLPTLSVYGLNFLGNKGKHNFKDRTVIISTATIILMGTVLSLKEITNRNRPNLKDDKSFPSGHTALSFMGAEFLHQEYKHKSPWYGITGYGIAIGTGYLRMRNQEHWLSDVITGAGIGILSTKVAYLISPYLQKKLFKNHRTTLVSPFYNGEQVGFSLTASF